MASEYNLTLICLYSYRDKFIVIREINQIIHHKFILNVFLLSGLKLEKSDNDSGMFIKASRKLDHYLLKPTLEKLLNRGNATFSGLDFCALG
jgi:hypothetical protein